MPLPYQQNKKYVYAWRLEHKDRLRDINRKSIQKSRSWKSIQIIFLNILLD